MDSWIALVRKFKAHTDISQIVKFAIAFNPWAGRLAPPLKRPR